MRPRVFEFLLLGWEILGEETLFELEHSPGRCGVEYILVFLVGVVVGIVGGGWITRPLIVIQNRQSRGPTSRKRRQNSLPQSNASPEEDG